MEDTEEKPADDKVESTKQVEEKPSGDVEASDAEGGRDKDETGRSFRLNKGGRRSKPKTARDVLEELVPANAAADDGRLRTNLTGTVLIDVEDSGRYLFDWSKSAATCTAVKSGKGDCELKISESDLLKLAAGQLNPQVVMLSHKVEVSGNSGMAIYFFNLISPM